MRQLRVPIVLAVIVMLTYGTLSPWLGFYGDDWPGIYNLSVGGFDWIYAYQSSDRPFWGVVLAGVHSILGDRPINWQIYALLTRWFSAIALWWLLRQIWPNRSKELVLITVLFLVYPGLLQEYRAFTFGTIWLQLSLSLVSMLFMVLAIRASALKILLTCTSILFALVSWNINEYFVGLELLRPIILWHVISEKSKLKRLRTILQLWGVYLIAVLFFIAYRLLAFDTSRAEVNPNIMLKNVFSNVPSEFLALLERAIPDIVETGLLSWAQFINVGVSEITSPSVLLAWVIGIAMGVGVFIYSLDSGSVKDIPLESRQTKDLDWASQLTKFGLFALIVGMLPIWYSGQDFELKPGYGPSRYALPAIFGSSVCFFGVMYFLIQTQTIRHAVVCLVVGLSGTSHIIQANSYRHEWADQKTFLSQLAWRIPRLEPGTLILVSYDRWHDRHPGGATYAMPINMLLGSKNKTPELEYWTDRVDEENNYDYVGADKFTRGVRNLSFSGSKNKVVVVSLERPGCLRVLSGESYDEYTIPNALKGLVHLSNTGLISADVGREREFPKSIFARNPEKSWCYFFEQAELARQFSDWTKIANLGDLARSKNLGPKDSREWQIFIEAYRRVNRLVDVEIIGSYLE